MAYDFDPKDSGLKPGVDLWRVASAEERPSKKGDKMFDLKLSRIASPYDSFHAYVMLEGNGRFAGRRQLTALLAQDFAAGTIEAGQLIGARVWVETVVDEADPNYGPKLVVKSKDSLLRNAGFQRESERPDCAPPVNPMAAEDVPF